MLARILAALLAAELGVYVLCGYWLSSRTGLPPVWIPVLAIALAFAQRLAFVAATFAFARAFRGPPAGEPSLSLAQRLRLFWDELVAFIALFSVLQPLEPWLQNTDTESDSPPVLLIHGIYCNRAVWRWMQRRLATLGVPNAIAINLEPPFAGIDDCAEQLSRHIERVCLASNAQRVVLVGHSMGGLVARAYAQSGGGSRVAKIITLGSPHHGSALAHLAVGAAGRQLRPGNSWLLAFNAQGCAPASVPIVSLYTRHDSFVVPAESAHLASATNVALAGIGHLSLLFSPTVAERVRDEIAVTLRCESRA